MNSKQDSHIPVQPIFRINALQNMEARTEVPVSLKIIQPSAWLWVSAVLSALLGLMIWGIFGTVTLTASATGIIMPDAGRMIAITGTSAGTVSKVNVSQGQWVRKGEVLAHVSSPWSQEELRHSMNIHVTNAAALSTFTNTYKSQEKELLDHFSIRARTLTNAIKNNYKMVGTLHDLLRRREKLYRQGYLSKIDFEKSRLEYFSAHEKLSSLKNALIEAGSIFSAAMQALQDKKMDLTRQYTQSLHVLRQKETEIKLGSSIISPADGTLTGVYITQGEYLTPKKPVFILAAHKKESRLHVLAFISAAEGKTVSAGMQARVVLQNLSSHESAHIKATVATVSDYPVTRETATLYLGNEAMVDTFFKNGPPFLAEISFKSGTVLPDAGTMATIQIITTRYSPIRLLMRHIH